jgi:membrane-associated phospholipid phosphatase
MCSNDFGNPSGHTMVGSVLYNVLVYYWFYERQKNWLVKIILVVLVSGWNILIGFDRIILGEHSFS